MFELGTLEYYLLTINAIGVMVYLINMLLYRHTANGRIDVIVTIVSLLGGSAGMLLMILLFDRKAVKENMMLLVFIRTPVTEKNPEKSRKGLYFIADNFIRFWFRYVYPYKGELELDNMQIVLDEMQKDFETKFVAFAYEDICKNLFADLCKRGAIDFVPSRIGAYWLNDYNGDTEIDVMAVDNQNKRIFAGECKYHAKSVDAPVYYALRDKVLDAGVIRKSYPGYDVIYGVFSKSGFTQRMLDVAK